MAHDLESLLDEYGIEYITTGKNTSKDWVNISCVGVGDCEWDESSTMGIHRSMNRGHCWYCAETYPPYRIAKGLGIPWDEWKELMTEDFQSNTKITKDEILPEDQGIDIPGEELHQVHRQYLEGRGYDVDFLIEHYKIKGTLRWADAYELSYRIIFPLTFEGVPISYLARSYSDDATNKYLCCKPDKELIFHKNKLFNVDKATGDTVIVCEGALDALKLIQASKNFNVIATYGTMVKPKQLQLLRERYNKVFVLFDNEGPAQEVAESIVTYMQSYGKEAVNIKLKEYNDPGELDNEIAKKLVDHLLGENNES